MGHTYPVTLVWPADTKVAMPQGRWTRLDDGRIEATYESPEELGLAMGFSNGAVRENVLDLLIGSGVMELMEKPDGPCNVCGATAWWERPALHGGGWVCGVCHPNPRGISPSPCPPPLGEG